MTAELIKIDRNGTKYFVDDVCPKCNGLGKIEAYAYVDDGHCYMCNGTGFKHTSWVERTLEYEAKLKARRDKRRLAKADQVNEKFLKVFGLAKTMHVVTETDTFSIKDELKEAGARFNRIVGWWFEEDSDIYDTVKIDLDDYVGKNEFGEYDSDYLDSMKASVNELVKSLKSASKSQHVGEIGDRREFTLVCKRSVGYETDYGFKFTNIYEDEDQNVFVWRTGAFFESGERVMLVGTIKAHSEFDGVSQTELTRCRVKWRDGDQ